MGFRHYVAAGKVDLVQGSLRSGLFAVRLEVVPDNRLENPYLRVLVVDDSLVLYLPATELCLELCQLLFGGLKQIVEGGDGSRQLFDRDVLPAENSLVLDPQLLLLLSVGFLEASLFLSKRLEYLSEP